MSSNTPTASPADDKSDWRKSIPQSYRSDEIRAVAGILATLEPGATSDSKMLVAMNFVEGLFQKSSSLVDFQKKLSKRLQKVQKSYKPKGAGDDAIGGGGGAAVQEQLRQQQALETSLRSEYGDRLRYILTHSGTAVQAMKDKHGKEKSDHLKKHIDQAKQWAIEIHIVDGRKSSSGRSSSASRLSFLQEIRKSLETRVENIRSHVVKLADPDKYLEEMLLKVDDDMLKGNAGELIALSTRQILQKMVVSQQAASTSTSTSAPAEAAPLLSPATIADVKQLLEVASVPVPPPREGQAEDIKEASLAYLKRIGSAAQAVVAYLTLPPDQKAEMKGVLRKIHVGVVEGMVHLNNTYVETQTEDSVDGNRVKLEDAWDTVLRYVPPEGTEDTVSEPLDADEPLPKRLKMGTSPNPSLSPSKPLTIRSQVLLTPGRKTPGHFLPALRAQKAEIRRPNGNGPGARLLMTFGNAFEMVVFFSPLLVTIRALPPPTVRSPGDTTPPATAEVGEGGDHSDFHQGVINGRLPTWDPPTLHLDRDALQPLAAGRLADPKSHAPAPRTNRPSATQNNHTKDLSPTPRNNHHHHNHPSNQRNNRAQLINLMGISAPRSTLSTLVAQKLHHASARATRVLRLCFTHLATQQPQPPPPTTPAVDGITTTTGPTTSDFGVEISEATALLHFLKLVRKAYGGGE